MVIVEDYDDFTKVSAAVRSALDAHCPIQAESYSIPQFHLSYVTVHPDGSWNAILGCGFAAYCRSPVSANLFRDHYQVYTLGGSSERLFDSTTDYSLSWSGTRDRSVSASKTVVFSSDNTFEEIGASWDWQEYLLYVTDQDYTVTVYTEGERYKVYAEDKEEMFRLGYDIDNAPVPFEYVHTRWAEIPPDSASNKGYSTAKWQYDDTVGTVEGGPDKTIDGTTYAFSGLKWSAYGHTFEQPIIDAFAKGNLVLIAVEESTPETTASLYEYSPNHSGKLTTGRLVNDRVRYCKNIARVESIMGNLTE